MAHIEYDKGYLLFIEPQEQANEPIIDKYTKKITGAFRNSQQGTSLYGNKNLPATFHASNSGYRGSHHCDCGAMSSNKDYLIKTGDESIVKITGNFEDFSQGAEDTEGILGYAITNNLAIHYVACHRKEIPTETLERILHLPYEPAEPTTEEVQYCAPDQKFKQHFDNLRKSKDIPL